MKKVLYVIDDYNYNSGAKEVTIYQMKKMKEKVDVYLLSLTEPREKIDFLGDSHILDKRMWRITELYVKPLREIMQNDDYTILQKAMRILYAFALRIGMGEVFFACLVKKDLMSVAEKFDDIVVVSEASKLRSQISKINGIRKIQWIHTDYAVWKKFSEWSRAITRHDRCIYSHFDSIVVLTRHCKEGMVKEIPSIEKKICVIPNMVNGDRILALSHEESSTKVNPKNLNIVTVARLDREKNIDDILQKADSMKKEKIEFCWYIIGDGPERKNLEVKRKKMGLDNEVLFLGYLKNPFSVMRQCDIFVLASKYEGTPVTIDESMVLGLYIIAPPIGGIAEQVAGYSRCLLANLETVDFNNLELGDKMKHGFDFKYRNEKILNDINGVL